MKICILTHCFYPSKLRGGPTVSMTNMVRAISGIGDVSVITIGIEKGGTQYDSVKQGYNRLFDCDVYYLSKNKPMAFYAAIKAVRPDVIYISSLFSWEYCISALVYGKVHHCRVILAPRGELMPSALKIKAGRKKKYLQFLKLFGLMENVNLHVTSDDEKNEVLKIFPRAKVWCISNLPQIAVDSSSRISKKPGVIHIAMIGRIHPIKNVDMALSMMKDVVGEVYLDIFGSEEIPEYVQKCKDIADTLPPNVHVRFCGVIDHDQMGEVFRSHHILLSPTQSENFGQAIVEALLTGMPVVISNNTPWCNLTEANAGWDISLENPQDFVHAINEMVSLNQEDYSSKCLSARHYIGEKIQIDSTVEQYTKMLLGVSA